MAAHAIVSAVTESERKKEPAMYSLDLNTNIAVERQSERMRAVRSVGQSHSAKPAAQMWATGDVRRNGGMRAAVKAGFALAALAIVMVLVVVASIEGAGGLVVSLVR